MESRFLFSGFHPKKALIPSRTDSRLIPLRRIARLMAAAISMQASL